MPPKFNRRRAVFVLGKIDEILAWEQRKETGARHQVRRTRALSMRSTGWTVLEAGEFEVFRRISGKAFSGIKEEGVLSDVNPRTPAAASPKAAEGSGMG
jgi:hypothetical protein